MGSAAFDQYKHLIKTYTKYLPSATFPWIPLTIAAFFQVFAWFGGVFLHQYSMIPRILILWLFALGEYTFMSPSMNASVEILKLPESLLVVIYQVLTLVVFIFVNLVFFKKPFKVKYFVSFALLSAAVYVAYMW